MKVSACIEWLFAESGADYAERIYAAADAGVDAVEFWGWSRHDLVALRRAGELTGVAIAAICAEPIGSLRLGIEADRVAFLDGVQQSCAAAHSLGAGALIVQSGIRTADLSRGHQHDNVVTALANAGRIAAAEGVVLLLEPINDRVTRPGCLVCDTGVGLDIVEAVGQASVRLLFDRYHSAIMGEFFPDVVGDRWPLVGHIHVADAPGRNEPGTGSLEWGSAFNESVFDHYEGLIGLEYRPSATSARSVQLAKAMLVGQVDAHAHGASA